MADFAKFIPELKKAEGGHVHIPSDKGGETIYGISRVWFPVCALWPDVARARAFLGLPAGFLTREQSAQITAKLKEDPAQAEKLKKIAHALYETEFWNRIRGSAIPSQGLANELGNSAVNCGFGPTMRWLRRALNILNRRGKLWPDMVIDGSGFGPETMGAFSACLKNGRGKALYKYLNAFQGVHYAERAERPGSDIQEENILGWSERVFEERSEI